MINKAKKVTALFFPTVTVKKKDGNDYRFIVFNRKKFLNRYVELKKGRQ